MFRSLAWALIIMLLLILGGHIALALLGGAVTISLTIWGLLVASVFFFCVSILLFFILTWTGVLVLGFIAAVWTVFAIFLFPVLMPVLLPLFLILFFVSYIRRKQSPRSE
ncbi:uncharacterized protein RVIR1_09360 [Candidatus Rickettsiella viridis]|uniref:Uncharacterized protein n=1 Tax=Candidatus Rickettsiella viridis TaxID=676208 RepID=A0A2Z5UWG7_9COXI|nr:hypothetical protein [Candidatus Rickettsiella viridis]BBB15415.1 uncharacterized protein RVIR1_09360 [Candidatus Rickettsiella viridis]